MRIATIVRDYVFTDLETKRPACFFQSFRNGFSGNTIIDARGSSYIGVLNPFLSDTSVISVNLFNTIYYNVMCTL